MRKLEGKELEEGMKFIQLAAEASERSLCKKSHRGTVLVKDGEMISIGYNGAPNDLVCPTCLRDHVHDNSKSELCYAVHAEQRALINALKAGHNLKGSRMYHIKVKGGQMVPSDDISCTICSRLMLEAGISEMALLHSDGLTVYDTDEFNRLSFEYFTRQ